MKPFSQNFEVLTQQDDVIKPKVARKKAQTCISFANGDTNLQMYLFLQSFYLYINSSWTFTSRHFGYFCYKTLQERS